MAFAVLVLWLRYAALPNVDRYRAEIVSSIERVSGMGVRVRAIYGGWEGLRPSLSMVGMELDDARGKAVLGFERAEVKLSWWTLLAGHLRFYDVDFYSPNLVLRRGADGLIYLADKPLNPPGPDQQSAFTAWLLAQPSLGVHDATLVWRDDKAGAPEVRLTDVQIELRKRHGRHLAALTARPPPELAGRIELHADVVVRHAGGGWHAAGEVFGEALGTDLARLRAHLPLPETLRSGVGSVRVWASFSGDAVREVVADINMRDAKAQLTADALPLELATLSGRAIYDAQPGGFTFATRDLRFRLRGGEEAQPGNFSIARTATADHLPRVVVRADGIDLKIAATLIDYFPVPHDIKAQAQRFAPRGRLSEATLTWTGADASHARTYSLKGRFTELAVNEVAPWPGVAGISGRIEGSQDGGTLELDSRSASLQLDGMFRAPLAFDTLEGRARWKRAGPALQVDIEEARFANADGQGQLAGTWRSLPASKEKSPGYADIKGKLTQVLASRIGDYLPNHLSGTRAWLDRAVLAGTSAHVGFEIKGDLWQFPFGPGSDGHFLVQGDLHGGRLKYLPDWPSVDAIEGNFRFENRRMEIDADTASIFASRASAVTAVIDDLGARPPRLTIDGSVDTSGTDSVRFLRESPLVNGPGAFTRAVAVEGPARLKLHLDFPLYGAEPGHVAGEYQFADATVSAGHELTMRGVRGRLAFTERGVRASDITGSLFGKPARLAMSTEPDGRVLTTIDGSIDAAAMAQFMPEAIARRLSGDAEWQARIVTGSQGTDLSITSDLKGLAATLPEPLAKAAGEARTLKVRIEHLGAADALTSADLEGGIYGRFGTMGPPEARRWHAALRFGAPVGDAPQREGLWLYGALASLDADAWQNLFALPKTPAAPSAGTATPVAEGAQASPSATQASPPATQASPPATQASSPAAAPATGTIPQAEASAAQGAQAAVPAALELRGVDLTLGKLHYFGRDFREMHAQLERSGGRWTGQLESPNIAGKVRWDPAGRGHLEATLDRLSITASEPGEANAAQSAGGDLPAIDVTADRFEFHGHWLGRLALKAVQSEDRWIIDRLDITNGHAQLHSTGGWRRTGTGSISTLTLKLETGNLNALLGQFGYGEYLKRGSGSLAADLVWPGYPYDFALAALAGTLKVDARRGQFAKIEAGAGKLLGLLSLQSLPRRATLDFRDVFSEGFAFDRIQGDVKVAQGVLVADSFEISGPAAFVSLSGQISLPEETQDLTMRVVPEVTEGLALAATLLGTPVLGLSTLVVSKLLSNPLGKAVAYEYQVTGSWDNPQVTRLSGPPPKAAAAASP